MKNNTKYQISNASDLAAARASLNMQLQKSEKKIKKRIKKIRKKSQPSYLISDGLSRMGVSKEISTVLANLVEDNALLSKINKKAVTSLLVGILSSFLFRYFIETKNKSHEP